ncbi:MAG TPA: hypothetical protein VLF67_03995 [Candidatus Saccharimonas sp.]|nr:hypothetical protein [Candidatus Saccharimonas sp.]
MASTAWLAVSILPLAGLISLLAHQHLDPGWTNPRVHFILFATVGSLATGLALAASEAARRR